MVEDKRKTNCERLRDLLPAYGFGMTDHEETRLVEQLLPLCPEVAAELGDYERLSEAMLFSAPTVHPPPHLLNKIMDAAAPPAVAPMNLFPRQRWLITAAAAVIVLLLLVNIATLMGLATSLQENTKLAGQVKAQMTMLALLADDDLLTFDLVDTREGGLARAVVLCNPGEKVAFVRAENFPALPPDMAYHIWLWRDGQRTSGGWLHVSDDGSGSLLFQAPDEMGTYHYIGLAPEPLGNVEQDIEPLVRGQLYTDEPEF